jgi:ppGpp synthetase/RelA/SpoT-type nucleotidyltranferase
MKIPLSIRELYNEQKDINDLLKDKVDKEFNRLKQKRWHYESRLKTLESFALKIETGRIDNAKQVEDFFACTLVVNNKGAVETAENLINNNFVVTERRPFSDKETHKYSNSFPFDDLRLYIKMQSNPTVPPIGVEDVLFEVQIKTFLQHAWTIATHDLIYKSDSISWSKERIAYQIKAMLEHAEVSISEAETIAQSKTLDKTNKKTKEIGDVIALIKEFWLTLELPNDTVLLANNVLSLIKSLKIDIDQLREILQIETDSGKGSKTLNLSPYGVVIQSLINQETSKIKRYLESAPKSWKFKVFISNEIEVPDSFNKEVLNNAIYPNT